MKKQLDIDKLHKVFESPNPLGKRSGNTTAVCWQAIGFADLGYKVFILVNNKKRVQNIFNDLLDWANIYNWSDAYRDELITVIDINTFNYNKYWDNTEGCMILFDFDYITSVHYSADALVKVIHYKNISEAVNYFDTKFGIEPKIMFGPEGIKTPYDYWSLYGKF